MGFFGMQTNQNTEVESQTILTPPEDIPDDLPELPNRRNVTVVAKGITVSGAVKGEGVVEVEGTVEGELELQGSVVVKSTGLVTGPVSADVIRIAGRVVGNITAQEHLLLETTGSIDGDVSTSTLVVENGGALNGRTTMIHKSANSSTKSNEAPSHLDNLEFGPDFKLVEDGVLSEKA